MLAASENYKGIKFVRISSLPAEQKNIIWKSIDHNSVIKILKEETLINDGLQYKHYVSWYEQIFKPREENLNITPSKFAIAS
jgi:hypothetical protein